MSPSLLVTVGAAIDTGEDNNNIIEIDYEPVAVPLVQNISYALHTW